MLEIKDEDKERIYMTIFCLVKDKELAEDIFQDTIVKVIESLNRGKYVDKGKFLSWAKRIAHNLCIDHFRKIKRTPVVKHEDNRDVFDSLDMSEDGIDEKIIKLQRYEEMIKLLDLIPENQREVIIMRHYADLSFKEIAKLTNCSINTALGRMRHGLMNLRKVIDKNKIAL